MKHGKLIIVNRTSRNQVHHCLGHSVCCTVDLVKSMLFIQVVSRTSASHIAVVDENILLIWQVHRKPLDFIRFFLKGVSSVI